MATSENTFRILHYKDSKIACKTKGEGDTTLLFVHGSFINMSYWKAQVDYFYPTYKVVTVDLPGHGQSTRGSDSLTAKNYGNIISFVINELHLKNIILVGHSAGADACLESIVKNPNGIIGFVAVDYFKNVGTPLPEKITDQVRDGLRKDFQKTVESYVRMGLVSTDTRSAVTEKVVSDYRNMEPVGGSQSIIDGLNYTEREVQLLEKLDMKVYMINVDYRPTNENAVKQHVKSGYTITTIHGSSHFPMIENPKEFNEALETTIKEIALDRSMASL